MLIDEEYSEVTPPTPSPQHVTPKKPLSSMVYLVLKKTTLIFFTKKTEYNNICGQV